MSQYNLRDMQREIRRVQQKAKVNPFELAFSNQARQGHIIKKLYVKNGFEIHGGGVCPEQYNVTKDGKNVAYYRLRHGDFTVESPDVEGELILEEAPDGDGYFESYERFNYLTKALRVLIERIKL